MVQDSDYSYNTFNKCLFKNIQNAEPRTGTPTEQAATVRDEDQVERTSFRHSCILKVVLPVCGLKS